MARVLLFLVGLCASLWTAQPARAAVLEAGAGAIDITPPTGFPLWGYAARKDQPSTGVRDALQARALVLAAGSEKLAFVSLDLGRAPPRAVVGSLRQRLKTAVDIEYLFLVASHTHHGPVLEMDDWPAKNPYVHQLEDKLFELVSSAAKCRQTARLGLASKETPHNRNRHSKRADRPVDREMVVLRVEDLNGKPIAHAVNFAAHPTILAARDRRWSADWPGALAARVEKETGVPCLFLQGAAGDLSPNTNGEDTPETFGLAVAETALALAKSIKCQASANPTMEVAEEEMIFPSRLDLGNPFMKAALTHAFFPALIDFYEKEYRQGVRPHLTVAMLDRKVGFVGVSGEVFCGHALALKRRARLDHLLFMGYCNDYQQYFPTIEAQSEGGYGTEPYISPAAIGSGEAIMDRALIHLYRQRGKLR